MNKMMGSGFTVEVVYLRTSHLMPIPRLPHSRRWSEHSPPRDPSVGRGLGSVSFGELLYGFDKCNGVLDRCFLMNPVAEIKDVTIKPTD